MSLSRRSTLISFPVFVCVREVNDLHCFLCYPVIIRFQYYAVRVEPGDKVYA